MGLKENVIVGKKIPAGTGLRQFDQIQVTSVDRPFREQRVADELLVEEAV
jgi:DNA-directed RNA polymerase subunit beta'